MGDLTILCRDYQEAEASNDNPTAATTSERHAPVEKAFDRHPEYPALPATVPLTYTLTMKACLSETPADRPTFSNILVLLEDLVNEVAQGSYVNSNGSVQVRYPLENSIFSFQLIDVVT
jgi:hypothetical protein